MLTDPRLCRGFSIGRTEKIWYTEEVVGCLIIKPLTGLTGTAGSALLTALLNTFIQFFYKGKQ
jgi:hypothetical protein